MPMPVYLIAGDADLDTALNELSCDLPGCKEPRAPRPQSDAEGFASRGSNDRYYFKYCKRTHALAGRIIPRSVKTQHQEESAPKCCRADCNEPAFIEPTLAPEGYNEPVTGRKHGFCCLTHFRSTVERGTCMRPGCNRRVYVVYKDNEDEGEIRMIMDFCGQKCKNLMNERPVVLEALKRNSGSRNSEEFISYISAQLWKQNQDPKMGVLDEREGVWQLESFKDLVEQFFFCKVVKKYGGKGNFRFTGGWQELGGSDSLQYGQFKNDQAGVSLYVYRFKSVNQEGRLDQPWSVGFIKQSLAATRSKKRKEAPPVLHAPAGPSNVASTNLGHHHA
eukprot:jgi/Tetstr1/441438/TSEL_029684.t1